MFVQELGKKAAVPSVYGLTFFMLGSEKCSKATHSAGRTDRWGSTERPYTVLGDEPAGTVPSLQYIGG